MAQVTRKAVDFNRTNNLDFPDLGALSLLIRHAKAYRNVMIAQCNGPEMPPRLLATLPAATLDRTRRNHADWCANREANLTKALARALAPFTGQGWTLTLGGDPRGSTVKLEREGQGYFLDLA